MSIKEKLKRFTAREFTTARFHSSERIETIYKNVEAMFRQGRLTEKQAAELIHGATQAFDKYANNYIQENIYTKKTEHTMAST